MLSSWKREVERGPAIDLGFGPHPATVGQDDALDDRQPDPGAFVVLCAVQALEHAEQLVDVTHVEPGPVVAHEIGARAGGLARDGPDPNRGRIAAASVL